MKRYCVYFISTALSLGGIHAMADSATQLPFHPVYMLAQAESGETGSSETSEGSEHHKNKHHKNREGDVRKHKDKEGPSVSGTGSGTTSDSGAPGESGTVSSNNPTMSGTNSQRSTTPNTTTGPGNATNSPGTGTTNPGNTNNPSNP